MQQSPELRLGAVGPNLASGDLNNDGKPEVVVNNGGGVSTWIGKGDGTFTAYEATRVPHMDL